jgi:hypothetical protein
MILVPLFDLKFLKSSPHPVQEFQIGGTSLIVAACMVGSEF